MCYFCSRMNLQVPVRFTPQNASKVVKSFQRICPIPLDENVQSFLKSTTHCMQCNNKFKHFRKKAEYCRKCAIVLCSSCCKNRVKLPFFEQELAVCQHCFESISEELSEMGAFFSALEVEAAKIPRETEAKWQSSALAKNNGVRMGEECVKTAALTVARTGVQSAVGAAACCVVVAVPVQGGLLIYDIRKLRKQLGAGQIEADEYEAAAWAEGGRFAAMVAGAAGGAALGSAIPGVGTVAGLVLGGALSAALSITAGSATHFGIRRIGNQLLRRARSKSPKAQDVENAQKLVCLMAMKLMALEVKCAWKEVELAATEGQRGADAIAQHINSLCLADSDLCTDQVICDVGMRLYDSMLNIQSKPLVEKRHGNSGTALRFGLEFLSVPFYDLESMSRNVLEFQAQRAIADPEERIKTKVALSYLRQRVTDYLDHPKAEALMRFAIAKIQSVQSSMLPDEKLHLIQDATRIMVSVVELKGRSCSADDLLNLVIYTVFLASVHHLETNLRLLRGASRDLLADGCNDYAVTTFEVALEYLSGKPWEHSLEQTHRAAIEDAQPDP